MRIFICVSERTFPLNFDVAAYETYRQQLKEMALAAWSSDMMNTILGRLLVIDCSAVLSVPAAAATPGGQPQHRAIDQFE